MQMNNSIENKTSNIQKKCILCNKKYIRCFWNFYNLCLDCFEKFDKIKMQGRMGQGPKCETLEQYKELTSVKEIDYILVPQELLKTKEFDCDFPCPKCGSKVELFGSDCYPEEGIGAECMNSKCDYELTISCTNRIDCLRDAVRNAHSYIYRRLKNV